MWPPGGPFPALCWGLLSGYLSGDSSSPCLPVSSSSLSAVAGKTTETGAKTSTMTAMPLARWPAGCPTPAASGTRYPLLLGLPQLVTFLIFQDRVVQVGGWGRQEWRSLLSFPEPQGVSLGVGGGKLVFVSSGD